MLLKSIKKSITTNLNSLLFISFFCLLVALPSFADAVVFKDFKYAKFRVFMVANQDYKGKDLDLRYTINDITVFKTLFQNVFGVKDSNISFNTNLSLSSFLRKSSAFKKKIKKNETIVIIYAGHGNVNGMPIFADKRTVSPSKFFSFINSFTNDTILIMDSCYSGAEGTKSTILNADDVDSATASIPTITSSKDVQEVKGYRKNILRIYSSLANQQSREAQYKKIKGLQKHLGKTYSFLEDLGYSADGNGIFSIVFASFFAELKENRTNYTYDSLNSFINLKISAMQSDGFAQQRPKIVPFGSPFKKRESYYLLYKNFKKVELSKQEKAYIQAVIRQSTGDYNKALSLYQNIYKKDAGYKDVKGRIAECYIGLAKRHQNNGFDEYMSFLAKSLEYNPKSLPALSALAQGHVSLKDYKKAITLFEKILLFANSYNSGFWKSNANNNIGFIYYTQDNLEKALRYFTRALEESRKAQSYQGQVLASNYIGSVYLKQREYDKALDYFEEAERVSSLSGDVLGRASALNNIAFIKMSKSFYKEAIKSFFNVLNILQSQDKQEEMIVAQNNIGFAYAKLKQYKKALEYYRKSELLYKDFNDKRGLMLLYINISDIYTAEQNYTKAFVAISKAEKLVREDDVENVVRILIGKSGVYKSSEKYKQAQELLVRAKAVSELKGYVEGAVYSTIELTVLYEGLAQQYISSKEYNNALGVFQKLLTLYKELNNRFSIGRVYANIGFVYYRQQRYVKALEFLNRYLSFSQGRGVFTEKKLVLRYIASILLTFGVDLFEEKKYKPALQKLIKSLEISRGLSDNKSAGKTALTIAAVYEDINKQAEVIKYYKTALDLFLEIKDLFESAKVYYRIGLYYNGKDLEKSHENLQRSFTYLSAYKAVPLYEIIKKDFIYSINLLAVSFVKRKKYKLANASYFEILDLLQGNLSKSEKPVVSGTIRSIVVDYWELKEYKEAIKYQRKLVMHLKQYKLPNLRGEQNNLKKMLRRSNR